MEACAKYRQTRLVVHLALLINTLSIGSLMMVMPLGPDLVKHLAMEAKNIGYISGGATFSSALAGFFAAPYLDRFNRKYALVLLLTLRFALITGCAFVIDQYQLLLLFILSGCVAGPAVGILMAAVVDIIPTQERGKKLAYIAMSFSLAAIIVVPISLEWANRFSWQTPFYFFGIGGLLLATATGLLFPSMPAPSSARSVTEPHVLRVLLASPLFPLGIAIISLQTAGHFLLIPHFSNYFQFNLHFPRGDISLLYLFGGLASMATMQLCGRLIDLGHAGQTITATTLLVTIVILCGFILPSALPLYLTFTLFMAASSARTSATMAVTAGIPFPHQRAAFMSYQGTAANVAAGIASMASAGYLHSTPEGQLIGFNHLALASMGFALLALLLVMRLLPLLDARNAVAERRTA